MYAKLRSESTKSLMAKNYAEMAAGVEYMEQYLVKNRGRRQIV